MCLCSSKAMKDVGIERGCRRVNHHHFRSCCNSGHMAFTTPLSRTLETPYLSAHRAKPFIIGDRSRVLLFKPLQYAVHVERVITSTPYWRASIPWKLAFGAACIKSHSADTTDFIVYSPLPCCNHVPLLDFHLHSTAARCLTFSTYDDSILPLPSTVMDTTAHHRESSDSRIDGTDNSTRLALRLQLLVQAALCQLN